MAKDDKPFSVIINGVPYAPVIKVIPEMESIARGLLASFWDEDSLREKTLKELMSGMSVRVFDDGMGDSIEDVLVDIAKELSKANEQ